MPCNFRLVSDSTSYIALKMVLSEDVTERLAVARKVYISHNKVFPTFLRLHYTCSRCCNFAQQSRCYLLCWTECFRGNSFQNRDWWRMNGRSWWYQVWGRRWWYQVWGRKIGSTRVERWQSKYEVVLNSQIPHYSVL